MKGNSMTNFRILIRDNHPDVGYSQRIEQTYTDLGEALIAKDKIQPRLSSYITVTLEKINDKTND